MEDTRKKKTSKTQKKTSTPPRTKRRQVVPVAPMPSATDLMRDRVLLDAKEAAVVLHCSVLTVRLRCSRGEVFSVLHGRKRLLPVDAIHAYLQAQARKAARLA